MKFLRDLFVRHRAKLGARDIFKYIGPGFLVTVGFIDPGNWASGLAAGALYGYRLLWVVTGSTLLLILLQHNAAHLGIATGLCLSEAVSKFCPRVPAGIILASAVLAAMVMVFAELLGAAVGLNMLVGLDLRAGAVLTAAGAAIFLATHSYRKAERWIIAGVGLIGLAFVYELFLVPVNWAAAGRGCVVPSAPLGCAVLVMAVWGSVVMPHNLFLHSEIIQSRQYNLQDDPAVDRRLRYEFVDTLAAMGLGWAVNCAIIILAAALFFARGIPVTELSQAQASLEPLLGRTAGVVFATALFLAGFVSTVTAAMAGGSIFAGIFGEPYDIEDRHSRLGIGLNLLGGLAAVFFVRDALKGLIWSQVALSIQLPLTVVPLALLTSSPAVMGRRAVGGVEKALLWAAVAATIVLNALLLRDAFGW